MLLKSLPTTRPAAPRRAKTLRALAAVASVFALLPLPGCSRQLTFDETKIRGYQPEYAETWTVGQPKTTEPAEPAESDEAEESTEPPASPKDPEAKGSAVSEADWEPVAMHSFLGLRYDDSEDMRREALRACVPDPCGQPSYSELRKARADAQATEEIKAQKGQTSVKSDGSSSNPSEVRFVAAPGALALRITADDNLNLIDGVPHAIVLNIYQLSDRLAADQLAATTDGIRKLLAGGYFDESVKAVRQLFIQPGTQNQLALDRAEGGRYVILVAGYNQPATATSVSVSEYELGNYSKKNGAFRKSTVMFCPLPLNLEVRLGPDNLTVSKTGEIYDNMRNSRPLRNAR